jgi:hypothetical protein
MNAHDKILLVALWAELQEQKNRVMDFADRYDAEKWETELGVSTSQQVRETVAGLLHLYEDIDKLCNKEYGV